MTVTLSSIASRSVFCQTTGASSPVPADTVPRSRAPVLALVQPPAGSTIPTDRPVVVFRFAPSEAADPIDVSSFRVWLDGSDRSSGFHVDGAEVWGSLAEPSSGSPASQASTLGAGVHLVTARLCTARGICSTANALVTVLPPTPATQPH